MAFFRWESAERTVHPTQGSATVSGGDKMIKNGAEKMS
jgi:hypothetical protein